MAVLRKLLVSGSTLFLLSSAVAHAQECTPFWSGINGYQLYAAGALLPFDDGAGPGLLIGGPQGIWLYRDDAAERMATTSYVQRFREITLNGQQSTYAFALNGTFRWSGSAWERLQAGGSGSSDAVIFDDGTGPALYLATFTRVSRIAATTTVIGEMTGGHCGPSSLAVWDDGSGPKLYVGGFFNAVNGVQARSIAAWDGTTWSEVGGGFTVKADPFGCGAGVMDLRVLDDGRGPALFGAGIFQESAGNPANSIARWDGESWEAVGGGTGGGFVAKMAVIQYQGASALWALGNFSTIGGIAAPSVARWDGTRWDAPLSGITPPSELNGISDVATFSDSSGEALFLAGNSMRSVGAMEGSVGLARFGCLCADLDGDGEVGLSDLALVLANFGQNFVAADAPGNVDQDRNIDLGDLSILLSQFGSACD